MLNRRHFTQSIKFVATTVLLLTGLVFTPSSAAAQIFSKPDMATLFSAQVMHEMNKSQNANLKNQMFYLISGGRTDQIFYAVRGLGMGLTPANAPKAYKDRITVGMQDIWMRSITYGYTTQKALMKSNVALWREVYLQWIVKEVTTWLVNNPTPNQKLVVIFDRSVSRNIVIGVSLSAPLAIGQMIQATYASQLQPLPVISGYMPYPPLIGRGNDGLILMVAWPPGTY